MSMFLLLTILFALAVAYFATQNTSLVTLHIASSIFSGIPLYMVMIIALLVGVAMAWLAGLADGISSMFALRGKDARIRSAQSQLSSMEKRIHDLEVENAHLKGETRTEEVVHDREIARDAEIETETRPIHHRTPLFPNIRSMFR